MRRRPIWSTSIRNSIGTAYRRISRPRSAISMSLRADGSGSHPCTATSSGRNATTICRDRSTRTKSLQNGLAFHLGHRVDGFLGRIIQTALDKIAGLLVQDVEVELRAS